VGIPQLCKEELWNRIKVLNVNKERIHALRFMDNYHVISKLDEEKKRYSIMFRSEKEKEIKFEDLYSIYTELYKNGWIDSNYMARNSRRFFEKSYISNGSAMLADLCQCDANIMNLNGTLSIKEKGDTLV
jgi:hypothetical protein